ncbi:MAG: hypothetical protein AAB074_04380 [Planctomycetota bacterium]
MGQHEFLAVVLTPIATLVVVVLALIVAGRRAQERLRLAIGGEPVLFRTRAHFRGLSDRAVPLRGLGTLALTETRLLFVMLGWSRSDLTFLVDQVRGVRSGGVFKRLLVTCTMPNGKTVEFQWRCPNEDEWARRIGNVLSSRRSRSSTRQA